MRNGLELFHAPYVLCMGLVSLMRAIGSICALPCKGQSATSIASLRFSLAVSSRIVSRQTPTISSPIVTKLSLFVTFPSPRSLPSVSTIVIVEKILIVSPSQQVRERLTSILEESNFQVVAAENRRTAMGMLHQAHPHVAIIFDDAVGRSVCARVRDVADIPIIALGEGDQLARIMTLQLGADVYLSPEVSPVELVARIRSLLRRYPQQNEGNPALDPETKRLKLGEQTFPLTPTEFRLLSCLMLNKGRLLGYPDLISRVWGDKEVSLDNLHFYIRRLKSKLANVAISGLRGIGYCLSGHGSEVPQ